MTFGVRSSVFGTSTAAVVDLGLRFYFDIADGGEVGLS